MTIGGQYGNAENANSWFHDSLDFESMDVIAQWKRLAVTSGLFVF